MASKNKWKLTPELKKRVDEVRRGIKADDLEFENTPQPCPDHPGKLGKFKVYRGAYTRGWAVFICPEGDHEFQVG